MTAIHDVYLSCDGCSVASAWGGEHPSLTAREAREYAASNGWVRRNKRDLCPQCAEPTT